MSHQAFPAIPVALAAPSGTAPDPQSGEGPSGEARSGDVAPDEPAVAERSEPPDPRFTGSSFADAPLPDPPLPDPPLPSPPLAECIQYFAATETAPAWARRHTADVLRRWNALDAVWAANQVVSELVTNAVQHAGRQADGAPSPCGLTLRLWPDALAVEVWDPFGAVFPELRAADPLALSGRGLAIVAALASAPVAVHRHPTEGKTVVTLLARTPGMQ